MEHDPLMRGFKVVVSISCPDALYVKIRDFREKERMNMSQACVRLLRLGLTYSGILSEQTTLEPVKPPKARKKKKAKPKTPSK